MSSIKRNVAASYTSQLYMAAAGIVVVPLYLKYMGAEAYGLIGFYSMLQAWFMLLDVGLTPTMIRETARFRGGTIDALVLRRFVRTLEGIFVCVATLGALGVMMSSGFIAKHWLKVQRLPLEEVRRIIILFAVIIALRWVSSLYKGAITGFERLVWLGGFNTLIATLRFVVVLPLLIFISATPFVFFAYQLLVAITEVVVLIAKTYELVPRLNVNVRIPWEWAPLKNVIGFSGVIAFTSSVWVVVTQTDKLLLSKLLPLSQYGYFALAVLLAGGVNLLGGPISGALLPRMVKLHSEGDDTAMIRLYRTATQMVAVIVIPASLVLGFFPQQVLLAWTGNTIVSSMAAPVLSFYALGNGILALSSFPYFLQFAEGDLKLHLIGSALFVSFLIPSLILGTFHYGMRGAGYAWLTTNALYLVIWVPLVHRRFFKGLHMQWILHDLAAIVIPALGLALTIRQFVRWPDQRMPLALSLGVSGMLVLAVSAVGSSWVRQKIRRQSSVALVSLDSR